MPELIGSTVARLVDAWSRATSGQPSALGPRVAPAAQAQLLELEGGQRVLDDARVDGWTCLELEAGAAPPRLMLAVQVSAAQQIRFRTAPTRGSATVRQSLDLRWELRADGPAEDPWVLASSVDVGPGLVTAWMLVWRPLWRLVRPGG